MTCRPARRSSATNGVVFQMSTAATAAERRAALRDPGDGLVDDVQPDAAASLMTPKTSLYIHFHICAETTVGIAQGTSIAARITPRPLKLELTTRAMIRPSTSSKATVTTVNFTVTTIESRKMVSCRRSPVVLQADELGRLDPLEELRVREAVVDRLRERIDRDQRDEHQGGREHQPREARLLALESRGPPSRWPRTPHRCRLRRAHRLALERTRVGALERRPSSSRVCDSCSASGAARFSRCSIPGRTFLASWPLRIWFTPWKMICEPCAYFVPRTVEGASRARRSRSPA